MNPSQIDPDETDPDETDSDETDSDETDPDETDPDETDYDLINVSLALFLSLVFALIFAYAADALAQQNALSVMCGVLAAICVLSTIICGCKTYMLCFPKPLAPSAPLPPDEIVDWQTTDDVSAYPARTIAGEQKKVVIHIAFTKQTTSKIQATILLRTQLFVQRAINEYFLKTDAIDYSGLDAVLAEWVTPLAESGEIQIYVRTVDIT